METEWETSAQISFLNSFQGLEHLRLMIKPLSTTPTARYWESIANHADTLRRFSCHERYISPEDMEYGDPAFIQDQHLKWEPEEGREHEEGSMRRLLAGSKFECLGLCDSLANLRRQLEACTDHALEMLHIRRTSRIWLAGQEPALDLKTRMRPFIKHVESGKPIMYATD